MKTPDLSQIEAHEQKQVEASKNELNGQMKYKQWSWYIAEKSQRIFILIGWWYNDITEDRPGWRIQLAEAGKEQPVIISLTEFEDQLQKGNFKQFYK